MNSETVGQVRSTNLQSSGFFAQSPFRSGVFLVLTICSLGFIGADAVVLIKYWGRISGPVVVGLLASAYDGAFGGILRVVRAHEKIYEECLAAGTNEIVTGSPLDVALQLTRNALLYSVSRNLVSMTLILWLVFYIVRHQN